MSLFSPLIDYLDSVKARDPAARSRWEVLLYPGTWALAFHRVAHWLYRGDMIFIARVVNHMARFFTAIDIHPGAVIGRHFFIDHGFTVIGETAEIGDNVTIYQNVTLGGTNPANGVPGKRHPTLADGVIIGAGAQVLGPILVGARARIGANSVVTHPVDPDTTVAGMPARVIGAAPKKDAREDRPECGEDFLPYGTPCSEMFDPATQQLDILRCEVERLNARLADLARRQHTIEQPSLLPDVRGHEVGGPPPVQ